jgi:hypothetical protein
LHLCLTLSQFFSPSMAQRLPATKFIRWGLASFAAGIITSACT